MKKIGFASLLLLLFSNLALPALNVSDSDGPSVSGTFQLLMEAEEPREIDFDASVARDGSTTGEITFRGAGAAMTNSPQPTDAETGNTAAPFYAKVDCDCLVVKGVEAVLSGTVTESSIKSRLGQRVLLVVEDGDRLTPPVRDRLTFGFYRTDRKGWIETDGERTEDQGPAPTWIATDLERLDDGGIISFKSNQITCGSFPLSSYSFISARQGKGKVQVTPTNSR